MIEGTFLLDKRFKNRIKARYDPTNLFRSNQNIAPSASAG